MQQPMNRCPSLRHSLVYKRLDLTNEEAIKRQRKGMVAIQRDILFLLFLCGSSATRIRVLPVSPEDGASVIVNYRGHPLEAKRPFGGVYGGSFKVGRRLDESDFDINHVASKRPFGRIFGNPYKLGKRGYPALENQYDMKRSTESIFENYLQGKHVAGDEVEKRPFGSIYGRSYKMGKRPFGGVYGKSYKMGKRYAIPLYAHIQAKRPFGKVYGKSYQFGKRPFGGIYGKNYGKRSFSKYRKDQELHLPFINFASLRQELENSVGHAKRPFGRVLNSKTILGKRHNDYADITTENLPFAPIYSTARSFSKRAFHQRSGYPNDPLMLLKRPLGQMYDTSYEPGKRSPRIYDLQKRSADTSAVVVVDEYGQPILLAETSAQDEHHPTNIQNMADREVTSGAPYTYDVVPNTLISLSTVFGNGEEKLGGSDTDNDDVMKGGYFHTEVYDSNGSDDGKGNLSLSEHIEFPEYP